MCSFWYPALNVQAPYCHLWPVRPFYIFPHCLIKGSIKKKIYRTQNMCFEFLYTFYLKHFQSKKKWARYDQKCILIFMWSTGYYCEILIKVEFSRKILEKNYLNSKFQENPSFGLRDRNCFTQEDGRTDMTKRISCFSQLCERVWNST